MSARLNAIWVTATRLLPLMLLPLRLLPLRLLPLMRLSLLLSAMVIANGPSAEADDAELAFFESKIRPVLVEHCYECHNSHDTAEGGLAVDHRKALLDGGENGPAIALGEGKTSLLVAVMRHQIEGLEMPLGATRLSDAVISDFERWIEAGAVDPRDEPPTADAAGANQSWEATFAERKQWWSFQPIQATQPPALTDNQWSDQAVDQFILRGLRDAGLEPNPPAADEVLVRRLFVTLHGLPPTPEELQTWTSRLKTESSDERSRGVDALIDTLFASSRYGERWARHWMDWIRYAESHGSEGDPVNPGAWQYRDYLIRALNDDVPYDQLLREHVAGDLLEQPRTNPERGWNESAIGTAHWRMVFHGFAPTDALDERVRFTDDQINAFSKAFLGLTVSCARCHHHKFDAISQDDYYALYGVLNACRPGRTVVDLPARLNAGRDQLTELKEQIRQSVAEEWQANLSGERLSNWLNELGEREQAPPTDSLAKLLTPLLKVVDQPQPLAAAWKALLASEQQQAEAWQALLATPGVQRFDLSQDEQYQHWYRNGYGLPANSQPAGQFALRAEGEQVFWGIYPGGSYSHLLSNKDAARLTSPDWELEGDYEVWAQVIGDAAASLRYVVQDYPRNGTVYPVKTLGNNWSWQRFDLSYWQGDSVHLELAAAEDAPLLVNNQPRSWFGIRQALLVPKGVSVPTARSESLATLRDIEAPTDLETLASGLVSVIKSAIVAWQQEEASDAQAMLLDQCVAAGILPNQLASLGKAAELIQSYRTLETQIPVPTRVPGLDETRGSEQPLFVRGNHKFPGRPVPRRFLTAVNDTPYQAVGSGRLELAADLLSDENPFTKRVIVNRVWHHLFGAGIVTTPDNFGALGETPSHPELLDWLANDFAAAGWSLKSLIRQLVRTQAWQQDSLPSTASQRVDPENHWLSHANVRRMEAEVIRDTLLLTTGQLDPLGYGPPVNADSKRRSIYLQVMRNNLDPFLRAFDFPEPFSTVGRREATNVPAQSLAMMNSPQVARYAREWAAATLGDPTLKSDRERLRRMFVTAFARQPDAAELDQLTLYLAETQQTFSQRVRQGQSLRQEISQLKQDELAILEPARNALKEKLQKAAEATEDNQAALLEGFPAALLSWDFEQGLSGQPSDLEGRLEGTAKLAAGRLETGGAGYLLTAPLQQSLRAKTLVAWVQLDTLEQAGGGVMTVQTRDGIRFDAIVFGERDPHQWLAGSDGFTRTQPFSGPQETAAVEQPVQIAIAYHEDGQIVGYRNGQPYGKPYRSDGPFHFQAGETVVSFGLRHSPAGGNRLLAGKFLSAQLYDRALSDEQIKTLAMASPIYLPDARVLESLTATEQAAVLRLRSEQAAGKTRLAELGKLPTEITPLTIWSELAAAMLTFKEFIYVR
ncbi:DUF1553 domain-containing protein [Planctomycetaceae bacterium SH139]